jgi:ribosomal protein L37AE/L43A
MLLLNADDQISPTKVFRTQSAPLVPNKISASGTMSRCAHGVYIPAGEVTAPYCTYCTPGGPTNQRPVVLPRSSGDPLNTNGGVRANKRGNGSCPQCGSTIYMRADERGNDLKRICADCGSKYRGRAFRTLASLAQDAGVTFDE